MSRTIVIEWEAPGYLPNQTTLTFNNDDHIPETPGLWLATVLVHLGYDGSEFLHGEPKVTSVFEILYDAQG